MVLISDFWAKGRLLFFAPQKKYMMTLNRVTPLKRALQTVYIRVFTPAIGVNTLSWGLLRECLLAFEGNYAVPHEINPGNEELSTSR